MKGIGVLIIIGLILWALSRVPSIQPIPDYEEPEPLLTEVPITGYEEKVIEVL